MKTLALLALFLAFFMGSTFAQKLKPGDPLTIELKSPIEDTTSVGGPSVIISPAGTIKLTYLDREIVAAGTTPAELARRIEAAYRAAEIYTNPTLNVSLGGNPVAMVPHIVNVAGEVRNGGGTIPLREGMRLLAAITACQGFTEFARTRAVRLIRGNKEEVYDMRRIEVNGSNNPELKDGDSIIVPQG